MDDLFSKLFYATTEMQETSRIEILDEESNVDRVKKISEILPVLGIILLFVGFSRHYFYYQNFGINISDYIETVEILLLFFPDLIDIFYAVSFFILYGESLVHIVDYFADKYSSINNIKEKLDDDKNIILSLFLIIVTLIAFFVTKNYYYQGVILIFDRILKNINQYSELIITVLCCSIYFTWILADYDNFKLKEEVVKNSYKIQKKDKLIIETTDNYYKIGTTNKYLFLYCEPEKRVEILKREDIDRIDIIKK